MLTKGILHKLRTMSAPVTVKTRVFILSDTHDGLRGNSQFTPNRAYRPPFPKADVVLHSGDLTMTGQDSEYRDSLRMLRSLDAELKLVIAGNHDLSLHDSYYLTSPDAKKIVRDKWVADAPGRARELWTSNSAYDAGIRYLEEGMHSFTLRNGAKFTIYASPWQPRFFNWAFNYPHDEDRWNPPHLIAEGSKAAPAERDPHPIPEGAEPDIVMTHGPAKKHLDRTGGGTYAGCPHLLRALDRVRPRLHCAGHIHEGWGAERVSWDSKGPGLVGESTEILAGTNEGQMGVDALTTGVIRPTDEDVISKRAAYLDMSDDGGKPLQHKSETLLINSCVVDLRYKPNYSGFLVDLDLSKA